MLTKETHQKIKELYKNGIPKITIATQLRLSPNTVRKHLKQGEWKSYKRPLFHPIPEEEQDDGPTITEYEDRMMKWRTGV